MPTQVTEFKCPACTAPLHFSEETGRLECDYCGSSFSVEEMGRGGDPPENLQLPQLRRGADL